MRPFHALVPAAGRGDRFAADTTKVLAEIAGRPALLWTLERLLEAGAGALVIALPADWVEPARERLLPELPDLETVSAWIVGGHDRQESVSRCLERCSAGSQELVVVHDGARLAVHPDDVRRAVDAAAEDGAAVLGRPATDTLKRVRDGWIEATVDRAPLFRAETPQAFRRDLLEDALARAEASGLRATDECALLEANGARVRAVTAQHPNPKLTFRGDVALLESLLGRSEDAAVEDEGRSR